MYQLTVLYNHPEDVEAFNKHYREVHAPLAAKVPALTSYTINWCEPGPDGTAPPYHAIATLVAESKGAMLGALGGPEFQAAAADLPNFAGAGSQLVFGEADKIV